MVIFQTILIKVTFKVQKKKITHMQFYSYRCMAPPREFEVLFHCPRLAQEYAVDNFCKIETAQLSYLKNQEESLQAYLYQGLIDQLVADQTNNYSQGRLIYLPVTHIGSDRFMRKVFQDTMAIVRCFGKPDLVTTFTCNPQWKDITEELHEGQTAAEERDLCTQVFHMKLKEFMNDIKWKHIFGRVVAPVHTIEFQKRGLPHCHLLLILASRNKLQTVEDMDKIVSAKIPDLNKDPELYAAVTHMMHGPCGELKPKAPCIKNRKCSKHYPRLFQEKTTVIENSYPMYKRRNNGQTYQKGRNTFTNQHVVPYNPFLLKKYNAHINVEICWLIKAVKYLYKYVTKGQYQNKAVFQSHLNTPNQGKQYCD